jgi:hypothetical protein
MISISREDDDFNDTHQRYNQFEASYSDRSRIGADMNKEGILLKGWAANNQELYARGGKPGLYLVFVTSPLARCTSRWQGTVKSVKRIAASLHRRVSNGKPIFPLAGAR